MASWWHASTGRIVNAEVSLCNMYRSTNQINQVFTWDMENTWKMSSIWWFQRFERRFEWIDGESWHGPVGHHLVLSGALKMDRGYKGKTQSLGELSRETWHPENVKRTTDYIFQLWIDSLSMVFAFYGSLRDMDTFSASLDQIVAGVCNNCNIKTQGNNCTYRGRYRFSANTKDTTLQLLGVKTFWTHLNFGPAKWILHGRGRRDHPHSPFPLRSSDFRSSRNQGRTSFHLLST